MEEPDGFQHCDVRILVRCRPCYLVNEAGRLSDPRMAGVSCQVGMPVTMHDAHSVQLAWEHRSSGCGRLRISTAVSSI